MKQYFNKTLINEVIVCLVLFVIIQIICITDCIKLKVFNGVKVCNHWPKTNVLLSLFFQPVFSTKGTGSAFPSRKSLFLYSLAISLSSFLVVLLNSADVQVHLYFQSPFLMLEDVRNLSISHNIINFISSF